MASGGGALVEESLEQGQQAGEDLARLGLVHDERRQHADDVVGGDVDDQARVERLPPQLPAGSPMPRTSATPSRRGRPPRLTSPTRGALASSTSSLIVSMVATTAVIASGLPPKVEP